MIGFVRITAIAVVAVLGMFVVSEADAHGGRQRVVQRQRVVRQRVVQRQRFAQPVVVQQQKLVQPFVAPVVVQTQPLYTAPVVVQPFVQQHYGVQQFVAPATGCAAFFSH